MSRSWNSKTNLTGGGLGFGGRRPDLIGVGTTLLQNLKPLVVTTNWLDYQSERHCSKTEGDEVALSKLLDYQSERHCSKTGISMAETLGEFDYQSERHCSKTNKSPLRQTNRFDYQSERHCFKTDSYTTDMTMVGKNGKTARVVVGWMKEPGRDKMKLTTIYVAKRKG